MESINVLYTVDKNYVNYMLVSMYSFLEHNPDLVVTFHIIQEGLDREDFERIDSIVGKFRFADYHSYEFGPIKEKIIKYGMPEWKNSLMANARLFFDSCVDAREKLLYLDSDTIIVDSVEGLSGYKGTLGMVKDVMPRSRWKALDPSLEAYYNSGVMWIDINKWHSNNCGEKIIKGLEKKSDYALPDQDLINVSLKDQITPIPLEFNVFSIDKYLPAPLLFRFYNSHDISRYSNEDIRYAKRNPIILHSTDFFGWKGWTSKTLHPNKNLYASYFAKIGVRPVDNSDTKLPNEFLYRLLLYAKIMCPESIKEPLKELLKINHNS